MIRIHLKSRLGQFTVCSFNSKEIVVKTHNIPEFIVPVSDFHKLAGRLISEHKELYNNFLKTINMNLNKLTELEVSKLIELESKITNLEEEIEICKQVSELDENIIEQLENKIKELEKLESTKNTEFFEKDLLLENDQLLRKIEELNSENERLFKKNDYLNIHQENAILIRKLEEKNTAYSYLERNFEDVCANHDELIKEHNNLKTKLELIKNLIKL